MMTRTMMTLIFLAQTRKKKMRTLPKSEKNAWLRMQVNNQLTNFYSFFFKSRSCGEFCTEFANSSGGCYKSLDGKNKTRVAVSNYLDNVLYYSENLQPVPILFIYQTDS